MKYMTNKIKSSVAPTCSVKRGGIKKKFQMNALSRADSNTGRISKEIAIKETVTSNISATTLYPTNDERVKQIRDTTTINIILKRICFVILILLMKSFSIITISQAKLE